MKIKLLCVGKTSFDYVNKGNELYLKRLKRLAQFEIVVVPDVKNAKNMPIEELKEKEGIAIMKNLSSADKVCVLDEKGKSFTSEEFAAFISKNIDIGIKQLVFIIGGAYGFSKKVYDRTDYKLSLSKMTFSHQIIRLIFMEQIYRAFTIIKGIPYHNQ